MSLQIQIVFRKYEQLPRKKDKYTFHGVLPAYVDLMCQVTLNFFNDIQYSTVLRTVRTTRSGLW